MVFNPEQFPEDGFIFYVGHKIFSGRGGTGYRRPRPFPPLEKDFPAGVPGRLFASESVRAAEDLVPHVFTGTYEVTLAVRHFLACESQDLRFI